jgi:hypothetical protein
MIPLASSATAPAADLRCGQALIARFTSEPIAATSTMSARDWVDLATSRLTATQACALVEHLFGVLPLLACFDRADATIARIAAGSTLGALGLFTPSAEPAWGAVRLAGEWTTGALRVSGDVRLPNRAVDGVIVLVRVSDAEQRLAWLDQQRAGVERDARDGAPAGLIGSPCWLRVDGALVDAALVSRPVSLASGTELSRRLDAYASVWTVAATRICGRIVLALRRAARTTRSRGETKPLGASQLVAMSITDVEIETELATAAIARSLTSDEPDAITAFALALAAARTLAAAAETARRLHDQLGLPLDAWLVDATTAGLTAYLGGTPMLEHELARALGLGPASDRGTP